MLHPARPCGQVAALFPRNGLANRTGVLRIRPILLRAHAEQKWTREASPFFIDQ